MRRPVQPAHLAPILGGMTAIMPLAVDMYLPSLPSLAQSLAADPSRVQLTLSTFFVGVALGQLLHGPLSDRFGRRPLMLIGLALYVLASVGCALVTSVEALIVLRFLQAIGACAGMVISLAVIRDSFASTDGARMISRMMLIHGAAPILAPLIGGLLLGLFGWRAIFWFLGLYGVLCLAGVAVFLPETRPVHTKGPTGVGSALRGFASVLSHRRFVGYALARAFASAGMFSYIAGSPFVFITLHGVSPQHFGFLFGLNAVGLIAASQINVRLLRRHSSERILGATVVVMALSGVLLVTAACLPLSMGTAGFVALLLPLFFCVACNGLINPNATALAMAPFGDRAGTASALIGALTFLIAGISSAVVSALHGESALPMAITIASVELLSLLCYFFVARAPVVASAPTTVAP